MNKEQIIAAAEKATKQWERDHAEDAEKIPSKVHALLDKQFTRLVATSLGFRAPSWSTDNWEVDSNRRGENHISTLIADGAQGVVEEMISGPLPKLTEKDKASLRKAYLAALRRATKEGVEEYAEGKAQETIESILADAEGLTPKVKPCGCPE